MAPCVAHAGGTTCVSLDRSPRVSSALPSGVPLEASHEPCVLPSCVPSRCPGRRSLVQSGPRSLAENGSKGPWQREPPARAARASRAPRPAPARRSLPTSSAAARSSGARCAPSSCVPSSCVPSPEGGPLSHGAGPNASRARRGVALPGAAAGGMAPWSHLHLKPRKQLRK